MTLERASNNVVRNKNESAWRKFVDSNPRKCDDITLRLGLMRLDDLAHAVKVMQIIPPSRIWYFVVSVNEYSI